MISTMALTIPSRRHDVPTSAPSVPDAVPTSSAAQRLADTLAKIAELRRPLNPDSVNLDDVDALATLITSRSSTADALELTVPALRRAVHAEELAELEARMRIEHDALDAARHQADAADKAFVTARVVLGQARDAWTQAEHRVGELSKLIRRKREELQADESRDPHVRRQEPGSTLSIWE